MSKQLLSRILICSSMLWVVGCHHEQSASTKVTPTHSSASSHPIRNGLTAKGEPDWCDHIGDDRLYYQLNRVGYDTPRSLHWEFYQPSPIYKAVLCSQGKGIETSIDGDGAVEAIPGGKWYKKNMNYTQRGYEWYDVGAWFYQSDGWHQLQQWPTDDPTVPSFGISRNDGTTLRVKLFLRG